MKILQSLKLLLPALIPSWNFFDIVAPSPRIEFSLLNSENENALEWTEFRPRPAHLSFVQMLKRMLWNPKWNESLFLVSCAERIMENYTPHSENEILKRIVRDIFHDHKKITATHLQFRLLFIQRQKSKLKKEVLFTSRIQALSIEDVI